jgi:DNA-binding protein YbaB
MFDKFKQLAQLKGLQNEIAKERFEVEENGIKVVVNGAMSVEEISLNANLSADKQGDLVKKCVNSALKKAQFAAAQKIAGMNLGF